MTAKNALMVCKCCYGPVRYSKSAQAWFHNVGDPEIETIAREITRRKKYMRPMRPVISNDISMIQPFTKPSQPKLRPRTIQIRNIRIKDGYL